MIVLADVANKQDCKTCYALYNHTLFLKCLTVV